eukprot:4356579-Prymnesium_polylepis.1
MPLSCARGCTQRTVGTDDVAGAARAGRRHGLTSTGFRSGGGFFSFGWRARISVSSTSFCESGGAAASATSRLTAVCAKVVFVSPT